MVNNKHCGKFSDLDDSDADNLQNVAVPSSSKNMSLVKCE